MNVTTTEEAARRYKVVRDEMTNAGITLPDGPIQVVLGLPTTATSCHQGLFQIDSFGSASIFVAHGLSVDQHDATLAHEITHGWLTFRGVRLSHVHAEGVC